MRSPRQYYLLVALLAALGFALIFSTTDRPAAPPTPPALMSDRTPFLADPVLQFPTPHSIRVVWFTEFPGRRHRLLLGGTDRPDARVIPARTSQLSRTREDRQSQLPEGKVAPDSPTPRPVWRHEAVVDGLEPGRRYPYRVASDRDNGTVLTSDEFSLAAAPKPGTPLNILLTSDHQQMPMTAANLQKVAETVGQIDAVFHAGDLVNVPDRASEWFDDADGNAFFPCLQGYAQYDLEKEGRVTRYRGAAIVQNAPLYPTLGNHEVMGRYRSETPLNRQYNDAVPRSVARDRYQAIAARLPAAEDPDLQTAWVKAHSFNADTYRELFSIPDTYPGGKRYYAASFGDVRLVVLYATNIWRKPETDADVRGRYQERADDLDRPTAWGYGQHIFEPISAGSPQYDWLQQELNSPEFQQATYKVVMFHHPPHSLGGNVVPPYTDPVPAIERDEAGRITAVRYEYPKADDYLIRDVVPLLEAAGVQLVYFGHSHLWNRFVSPAGTHYLESSNVGNSYGAFWDGETRNVPRDGDPNYAATGDPNGLDPVVPTLAPLRNDAGDSLPYIASNDITAFSIFNTGTGTVSSYYFDTRKPDSAVVKFDEFSLAASD